MLGNHEDSLIAVAISVMRRQVWYAIGGAWAETLGDDQLEALALRLAKLPLVRIVGEGPSRFNVLHAKFFGSDADLDAAELSNAARNQMLWGRGLALGNADASRQKDLSTTYVAYANSHYQADRLADLYRHGHVRVPKGA